MSFAGGFKPVSYETLFGNCQGATVNRESWGMTPQVIPQNEAQKRRKSTSVIARKKAKMTRGDEKIDDETAKQAAKELLDQIQDTPGQISLNLSSPQSAGVCPLPPSLQQTVNSQWTINRLQEGQLATLLAQNPKKFQPLKFQSIHKGDIETQILPRQMNIKETIEKLKNEDPRSDQYVGFAAAIANVLRRCDTETADKLTHSITATIDREASTIINK